MALLKVSENINKDFREYRRMWDLVTDKKIVTAVPLHLDIELTNLCNLTCKMCWQFKYLSSPKGYMDFKLYKKIIDEGVLKGVKAIKLQSRGEAMLHPKIMDAIRYAKEKGILDIQLTTNGTLLFKDKWLTLLDSGLNILTLSLDAAHEESFNHLYKEKTYKTVLENIIGFLQLRKNMRRKEPLIKLQMAKSGVKLDPDVQKRIDKICGLVDKVIKLPVFYLVDDKTKKHKSSIHPCRWLWQRMVINFDGKVTMCCRDYNCVHLLGDIHKQSLEEIWQGRKYSRIRALHSARMRKKVDICVLCELS